MRRRCAAWAERRPILPALGAAACAGCVGRPRHRRVMLVGFWWVVRAQAFAAPVIALEMPLATKLLYGGIVEELLLRWRRDVPVRAGSPGALGGAARPVPGMGGVDVARRSALLGRCSRRGHLPVLLRAAARTLPALSSSAWRSPAISSPGMLFGWLYWRQRAGGGDGRPRARPSAQHRRRWRCSPERRKDDIASAAHELDTFRFAAKTSGCGTGLPTAWQRHGRRPRSCALVDDRRRLDPAGAQPGRLPRHRVRRDRIAF